jgi:dTDP-4-dehydrorhamnose 3,5-epimerase
MQINVSRTNVPGTIRGLHFQRAPAAETKLVRCLRGKVFDVAVDLRPESKTYLQYHAEILEPTKKNMLVIPEGCAHGFQVLEGESELLYLHTAPYSPEFEGGVRYDDPSLNIVWPMPAIGVSERDSGLPLWNTGKKEFLQ